MTAAISLLDHEAANREMTWVQVVLDPGDSLRARQLAACAARPGVVVCRATPEAVPTQLARDVLRALGKRFDVADSPRRADRLWPRVTTWLLAEDVGELIVLRGHLLPADSVMQLLGAMRRGMQLTLFVHASMVPPTLRQAFADADVAVQCVDVDRYAMGLPSFVDPREPPARTSLPVLPRDDFLFFPSACAEVLDDKVLDRVCEVIAAARRATDRWLDSHLASPGPSPGRPSTQRVLAFLGALTDCEDSEEALARLRGAQTALLFDDLLVDVDARAFVAAHRGAHAIARLDARAVSLLRTYSSPVYAAAGAVALAAGAAAPSLSELTIESVASDGGEVRLGRRTVVVAEHARGLLRAQLITREAQGGQPTDAFFMSARQPDQAASSGALRAPRAAAVRGSNAVDLCGSSRGRKGAVWRHCPPVLHGRARP